MKVLISPRLYAHRGGPVEVGNVYSNKNTRFFRVVMGINPSGRWNKVVCLHVDATGEVVGASCQPERYMSEHQDLVGRATTMPQMKIEWNKED